MPNVLVTPHVAGWTSESYRQISDVLSTKIKHFLGRL
jgi:phosphoglycerate dehydrogenase-like enzyme